MKGKLLASFFCFILASAWMVPAVPSERFVASNGNNHDGANDCLDESLPCETITQAIARANPGDKITVKGGQYECEETFPITITTQPLTIEAASTATIEATGCDVPEGESIIHIKASDSTFINFTIKGGEIGIKVEGASNVEIGKITLESVGTGILLSNASQITLGGSNAEKIEIEEPTEVGIKLETSAGNTITHNEITKANKGIVLEGSHRNQLSDNTIENSGEGGIEVLDSNENDILTNNITQPDQDSISASYGIFLSSQKGASRGNALVGNTVSGFKKGIAVETTGTGVFEEITLSMNSAEANGTGIRLSGTLYDSVLIENTANNNISDDGIFLQLQGNKNNVTGNTANENSGNGITFIGLGMENQGPVIEISDNTVIGNAQSGVRLENSLGNAVSANTIQGNTRNGIMLINSSSNELAENDVRFHGEISSVAISLESSDDNRLYKNRVEENGTGISLGSSRSNRVNGNSILKNKCNGIELHDSSDNQVWDNTVTENAKDSKCQDGQLLSGGIALKDESVKNSIMGNTIQKNQNGVIVRDSAADNSFECNEILESDKTGILLISAANKVTGNRFQNNNIVGNKEFGLRNYTNESVDARFNWWGSPLGPQHPDNPQVKEGKADKILGPSTFTPWREIPIAVVSCTESRR